MDKTTKIKMIYGYILLLTLAILALSFGIGHVEEKTSYGLMPIVVAISSLSAQWAQWAFSKSDERSETKEKD